MTEAAWKDIPAFPKMGQMGIAEQVGMTLRDYFAAKAMEGYIACSGDDILDHERVSQLAYHLASCMLKERAK